MKAMQVFSWGYANWGRATGQLVAATSEVERQRGFQAPVFVDVRLRRAVRAPGFVGNAFRDVVGDEHYFWMPDLGNASILTGGKNRIARPAAAEELLDLVVECLRDGARVIFLCSCESPFGLQWCHRRQVAELLRDAAKRRRVELRVSEWLCERPSAESRVVRVSPEILRKVEKGAAQVSLGTTRMPEELVGLPWGSIVTLRAGAQKLPVAVGPAAFRAGSWVLPRLPSDEEPPPTDTASLRREVAALLGELPLS